MCSGCQLRQLAPAVQPGITRFKEVFPSRPRNCLISDAHSKDKTKSLAVAQVPASLFSCYRHLHLLMCPPS